MSLQSSNDDALIKALLSVKKQPSALLTLLDGALIVLYTNNDVIFQPGTDVGAILQGFTDGCLSEGSERMFKAQIGIDRFAARITPLSGAFGEDAAFLLELFDRNAILSLIKTTGAGVVIGDALTTAQMNLNQIIQICMLLEGAVLEQQGAKDANLPSRDYVKALMFTSQRLLTETHNLAAYFDEEWAKYPADHMSVGEVLDNIVEECVQQFKTAKRRIIYTREGGVSAVDLHERRFTTMFMNILQNALLYSPSGSEIRVSLRFDAKNAYIDVVNTRVPIHAEERSLNRPGLGLPTAKRILSQTGGKLELILEEARATARIIMPLSKEYHGVTISTNFKWYKTERFKPVHLFLGEIVAGETNTKLL